MKEISGETFLEVLEHTRDSMNLTPSEYASLLMLCTCITQDERKEAFNLLVELGVNIDTITRAVDYTTTVMTKLLQD